MLATGIAAALIGALPLNGVASTSSSSKPLANRISGKKIKALVFDVYGTSTDYWGTIVREGQAINQRKGLNVDWPAIAKEWHGLFPSNFQSIIRHERPWQNFSSLRLEALESVLRKLGVDVFSSDELVEINAVWQRAQPWPDVVPGLHKLHKEFILATLSNADMADMVKLARHNDFRWDLILTSELVQRVKPDPLVYQLVPRYLGLAPEEILMVACHKADLLGAAEQGIRTAFVPRPMENGPAGGGDIDPDSRFDINVSSFLELSSNLSQGVI
ncbi:haloacid dehalogenase, type II [Burkholderia sp. AU31652]|nr:haloacid dehalogenase, type II [Burkholderia sp. AU31652]